jgi:hypothetical protein
MLSDEQRRRLEEEKNYLEQPYQLQTKKIASIRNALVIETDPSRKFQSEQEVQEAEKEREDLNDRLDEDKPSGVIERNEKKPSSEDNTSIPINKRWIFTFLSIILVILFVIIFKILYYPASKNQFTDFQFPTKHKTEIIPISNPIYKNPNTIQKSKAEIAFCFCFSVTPR